MTIVQELEARGFIHQTTAADLPAVLDSGEPQVIYLGVDPTADSIHAGNFAVFMLLRHLAQAGHKIILLVGGGTGMIGDPKPDVERQLIPAEEIQARVASLTKQVEQLLGDSVIIVNNYDWLGKTALIDFLRDIGKHFTINELLKKDAIATRVESDHGISYTEFAYPLLQAYDYLILHQSHNCSVQVGGSDQWGNIVAGVDLVRRKTGRQVHALTTPLIIDKTTGKKFGKSEGNAVWLSATKTSPYHFYQFWRSVADENVTSYLKIFSPRPLAEIENILAEHARNPEMQVAQQTLAADVTGLVHGAEMVESIIKVSDVLFGEESVATLNQTEQTLLCTIAPTHSITTPVSLVDTLVDTTLAASKREARTFITSGAIRIDNQVISDVEYQITGTYENKVIRILQRGKKQYCVLIIQTTH